MKNEIINSNNYRYKWHIQKEDSLLQDKEKEGRTTMLNYPPWLYAPIVAPGISIIPSAANAGIIEENWQLKKRLLHRLLSFI